MLVNTVSSHLMSSTSSDSDSRDSEDGGEIRNVGAAPSGNTTLTATKAKHSKPSTLFKRVGGIVCLREEPLAPTKWSLAGEIKIHQGKDGMLHVVTNEQRREGTDTNGENGPSPYFTSKKALNHAVSVSGMLTPT